MNLSGTDRDALSRALDDSDPDREHFWDPQGGVLWTFVLSEATDESRRRRDAIAAAIPGGPWMRIPSRTTGSAFEEMEDFVEEISDAEVRNRLFAVLESKGAFRAFREFLLENAPERSRWEVFRSERSGRRLAAFLDSLPSSSTPAGA